MSNPKDYTMSKSASKKKTECNCIWIRYHRLIKCDSGCGSLLLVIIHNEKDNEFKIELEFFVFCN